MKKIVLFLLMMLPMAVMGQSESSTEAPVLSEEAAEAFDRLPAVAKTVMLTLLKNTQIDEKGGFWVYSGDTIRNSDEMTLRLIEDNKVTKICNIPFGTSYKDAKNILTEKYGSYDYLASTKDCIIYRHKSYAGSLFTKLLFMFQSDGENSYFNKAVLCKETRTKEEAVRFKHSIDDRLSKQYQIYNILDDDSDCLSLGGICPVPSDGIYGGYAIGVDVMEYEYPSDDGYKYAVRIMYGPYDYVEELF